MFCNNWSSARSRPKKSNRSHKGENKVTACSNNNKVTTMVKGTKAEYGSPSKYSPARRTSVTTAKASEAVTGPRSSHLNKRLLTIRSGHETPKNATAYAMTITRIATSRLMIKAVLQKNNGYRAARSEPNKR